MDLRGSAAHFHDGIAVAYNTRRGKRVAKTDAFPEVLAPVLYSANPGCQSGIDQGKIFAISVAGPRIRPLLLWRFVLHLGDDGAIK
jgi:hypothetical protein